MNTLKIGDEVTIKLIGVVDLVDPGHGLCYRVHCDQQDFVGESQRRIWVNDASGEIIARSPKQWPGKYRCVNGHEFIIVTTVQLHPACPNCYHLLNIVPGKFIYIDD